MSANDVYALPLGHRAIEAIAASAVLLLLAIVLVASRFYIRRNIIKSVQTSDWVVFVSLVLSATFVGIFIARNATLVLIWNSWTLELMMSPIEAKYGTGQHQKDLNLGTSIFQKKLFWIGIPFYNAAMVTAKASIIVQYFHVFPTKKMRLVCWIMGAILALCGIWMVTSAFLNCIPVAGFWSPTVSGECLPDKALWYSNASINMLTDLAILIVPIPALISLDLPLKQKIGLCCIFALGWFVCITSICRLQSLKVMFDSNDYSYHSLTVSMWSAVESNTGIISASLPTLRPALTRIWPSISFYMGPGARANHQARLSDLETGLHERGHPNMSMIPRTIEVRGQAHSGFKNSVDTTSLQQQPPPLAGVKLIPKPGNGFAQNLMRKGSFFEQCPVSYV